MNWTWSLGECWWVVMKLVSLQKAGIWAGGGQGSGSMPQLLSTGEGEHSKVSMKRTAGKPLLMKDTWSLARPGRSSRSLGAMVMDGTYAPPQVPTLRMTPRDGEVLSVVPSGSVLKRSRGIPEEYSRKFCRSADVFAVLSPPGMSVLSIAITCGCSK